MDGKKQISCNRNSKENATHSLPRDDGAEHEYRLSCAINNRSKCRATMNGAEEFNNLNTNSATMVQIDNVASIRDLSDYCSNNNNPQMPSSSSHVQPQQFIIPVSLTNNVVTESSSQRTIDDAALRCNHNKDSVVDVNRMNVVECNQNMVEDAIIITSAIDNNLASSSSTHGTPSKAKYSSDIVTVREKRRRNRRDRRLARTRASGSTSEILPDILNSNPRPPPYSSLPPIAQPQIPSIISTVPVEDTRYTFSLPLVRR